MHQVFSLLAIASSVLALPTPDSDGSTVPETSFRIPVVKVNTTSNHAASRYTLTSDASPYRDGIGYSAYWFANLTAGKEPLDVVLDTGSAVLWVLGPNSPSAQKAGQEIYDPSKSTTSKRVSGETFDIAYGDGSNEVGGPVYTDNLCLGNACVNGAIATADTLKGFPAGNFKSGILGLSFGASSQYTPKKLPTFFESLQKSLAAPTFTCYFKMDNTGYIQFGSTDASTYTGSLQSVAIDNSTGSWNNNAVSFYAGGKQLGGPIQMNFDTGSPNTYLPNATIANYHAQIKGATYQNGGWTFPCSSTVPEFQFHFPDGAIGHVPGKNMIWYTSDGGTTCVSWLIPVDGRGSFGDPFFQSNVVVFNQKVPSIAFAPKA